MSNDSSFNLQCPVLDSDYAEVLLAHGGGGALTNRLIERLFKPAFGNPLLNADHDGAVFNINGTRMAFSTDSYVVRPCFFPGGDIGSLAVYGTINDLAMCGARPLYFSVGLILEEGFSMHELQRIVVSMKEAADSAGVQLVTGDTKVVDRGHGDGVYINTSGVGVVEHALKISPGSVRSGDVVILSGDIGRHGMAVMSVREGLTFESRIESDTAALSRPVQSLLNAGIDVHCLRDPTRGGVATALVEIARTAEVEITITESAVPVSEAVRGACEILGLDPLYVANEGRFVAFVPATDQARTLALLRADELCQQACVIGHVIDGECGIVTSKSGIGGQRVLDMLSGEQLPRIC
jgi:hydrogenase expression/formation protein HypE